MSYAVTYTPYWPSVCDHKPDMLAHIGDSDDEAGSMKSWCQTSNINWLMSDDDEAKSTMTDFSMLEEVDCNCSISSSSAHPAADDAKNTPKDDLVSNRSFSVVDCIDRNHSSSSNSTQPAVQATLEHPQAQTCGCCWRG